MSRSALLMVPKRRLLTCSSLLVAAVAPAWHVPASSNPGEAALHIAYDLPGGTDFTAISCPTVEACTAVGGGAPWGDGPVSNGMTGYGAIFATKDGGRTWAREVPLQPSIGPLSLVSCPTTSFCLAASTDSLSSTTTTYVASTDGGAEWATRTQMNGVIAVGIACVSATRCFATEAEPATGRSLIAMTSNGGRTWASEVIPGISQPSGLSCRSTTCFIIGLDYPDGDSQSSLLVIDRMRTTGPKRVYSIASSAGQTASIACSSTTTCFVATEEGTVLTTINGGKRWTLHSLPSWIGAGYAASCFDAAHCDVVGRRSGSGQLVALSTANGALRKSVGRDRCEERPVGLARVEK